MLYVCRLAALSVVAAATVCLTASTAWSTPISFPNFTSTAGLTLNGAATTTVTSDGTVLRLTPATGGERGSAFSTSEVTLGSNDAFSTFFQFRITNPSTPPADGFTFVLQTAADTALGGGGGGLGYLGIGGNSLAVEFDTFNNGPADGGTLNSNHVALDFNGSLSDNSAASPGGVTACAPVATGKPNCMANGDLWSVWIDYTGTSLGIALADNSTVRPPDLILATGDLSALLGQNTAFVGFTAATGAAFENHDIVDWQFTAVPEPASLLLLGTGLIGVRCRWRHRRKNHA